MLLLRQVCFEYRERPLELLLLWGSKMDQRSGQITLASGEVFVIEDGGYEGYRWHKLTLPVRLSRAEALTFTLVRLQMRRRLRFEMNSSDVTT